MMKTNLKMQTAFRGKKENPIELVEAQVLNGQIITLSDLRDQNDYAPKAIIKAFFMALKR